MAAASTQPDDGRAHSAPPDPNQVGSAQPDAGRAHSASPDRSQAGSAQPARPSGPAQDDPAATLASARYVSLTTFRRTGDPVATPVWIAPADPADPADPAETAEPAEPADPAATTTDTAVATGAPRRRALVTISMADAGKVKRLGRDPRVELQVCDVRGRVRPHTPVYPGTAALQRSAAQLAAARQAMARKYLLARVGAVAQRVLGRIRPGKQRVAIRITVADPPQGG